MPAIPINLTIPANKNVNDVALTRFLLVYPNTTANPSSPQFVPASVPSGVVGITDRQWMAERTRQFLVGAINAGAELETRASNPAPRDDDVVER